MTEVVVETSASRSVATPQAGTGDRGGSVVAPGSGTMSIDSNMNGFTAVNGRGSPISPTSQSSRQPQDGPEGQLIPQGELSRQGGDPVRPPQTNGSEHHTSASPANGMHNGKRKRSIVDDMEPEDVSTDDSTDRSSTSPQAHDMRMQDGSTYHRANTDNAESTWNHQQSDDQAGDLRMLAPIQRENQQYSNDGYSSMQQSHNGAGMRPGYQKNEATGLITTNAGVIMDPKKRKRAFTNRTKTGCQTCRKRKKKCDEEKPYCKNCTRGGFQCAGYSAPRSIASTVYEKQKSSSSNGGRSLPPTLQGPPRELQEFTGNLHPRPSPRNEPPPAYLDMSSNQPSIRSRPIPIDDDQDRTVNGWPSSPYTSNHRSYGNDRESGHGLQMHGSMGMRESYDRPISTATIHGIPVAGMHPAQAPHHTIQVAQQALRHTPQMGLPPFSNPMNMERQKMLNGDLYMPFSQELESDREKCAKALYTFNNNNHTNRTERMRHLRSVLSPEDSPLPRLPGPQEVRVGKGAAVDAPFRCEYGYNITFGSDVVVESGCYISDPRDVHIGAGSYIGAGVKIMGKVLPHDPNTRGSAALEGKARGFEIIIGKNVHIGAGSVVQPDEELVQNGRLEIGEGTFIKPMSLVNKSVPQYVIYGPKSGASDVISGIVYHGPPGHGEDKRRMGR